MSSTTILHATDKIVSVRDPLPIDPYVDDIVAAVRRARALVLTAEPGAGKTTRVPPALVDDGPVILLQPRRVAARAIAGRIAAERGWTVGEEVGWHVRFERRASPRTRLLVATEGILTARLQQDPLLSGFRTVVLDEFHERSIHADVGLALAREAWRARDDLRIVVMSATLDAAPVAAYLDGCPVITVPGRTYPLAVRYAPGQSIGDAVSDELGAAPGSVLCFLPGAGEIRRAADEIRTRVERGIEVVPLHGGLPAAEQDAAIRPGAGRRVVVATNIAETSLTVPGVTSVVDSGLQKVARFDAARGIDALELERVTGDAADQRAGRAGRLGPGRVVRLWDARDRLRPHREAEIRRVDLAATVLDVIAWGGDPRRFEWFEAPSPDAVDAALELLQRLGALAGAQLTPVGARMRRMPLHPRLAALLVRAGASFEAAATCAVLSERVVLPPRTATTTCDVLSVLDRWREMPESVRRVAQELERVAAQELGSRAARPTDDALRHAIFHAYADRVARRREPIGPRFRLARGGGAVLASESGVRDAELIVALDVQAGGARGTQDALIRIASRVEPEWLEPTGRSVEHVFDREAGRVKAYQIEWYDTLRLRVHPVAPLPEARARLLAEAVIAHGLSEGQQQFVRRLRFAGHAVDVDTLVQAAAAGATRLEEVDLARALDPAIARDLARLAPEDLAVPSGRRVRLDYAEDGSVSAAVKLQELFGLADTPRLGPRREPVLFALLAPNGRPVQRTRDLRSFWQRTYPEVRKELRGRYPRHPWPDDPWTASPTARTTRRRS